MSSGEPLDMVRRATDVVWSGGPKLRRHHAARVEGCSAVLCCAALCRTSPQIASLGSTRWQGQGTRTVRHLQHTA